MKTTKTAIQPPPRPLRIGIQTAPYDPFWVLVHEAIFEEGLRCELDLVEIDLPDQAADLSEEEQDRVFQELHTQEINAFICINLPEPLIRRILGSNLPAIYLDESSLRHAAFVSSSGMYEAAHLAGQYLKEKLTRPGCILCAGGDALTKGDPAASRLNGLKDELRDAPHLKVDYLPSAWRYEQAHPQMLDRLLTFNTPFDAVIGFSDSLALAVRDAGKTLGLVTAETLVVGINGDPAALVAIGENSMHATVDMGASEFGRLAVALAGQAARHEPLPPFIRYEPQLVTSDQLQEVALRKLIAIANLPRRLVGVHRRQDQTRMTQLEISAAINKQVAALRSRQHLTQEIVELIRLNYGYDLVQFVRWDEAEQELIVESADRGENDEIRLTLDQAGLLAEALRSNEAIFIPDTHHSRRFSPESRYLETRTRVILPVRLGEKSFGLLDLHSHHSAVHLHQELIGLQSLADQLAIAISNAELYAEALSARAAAEKADQLKTRLLANVGHELRSPTNTILGYTQMMLNVPNPYQLDLSADFRHDLENVYRSGEYLTRLINDLLDLSRAEIGELDLFPETIATRAFLEEVFQIVEDTIPLNGDVHWRLLLPARLPMIQADAVRLRQVLLNLLHNASKFTTAGEIVLGAEVQPPNLHLWVTDSGPGISPEMQERIFEPFVTAEQASRQRSGIGLGLSITRRLVALHSGSIVLDSTLGVGSTFHVYLPLPNLSGQPAKTSGQGERPVLLELSSAEKSSAAINDLCQRQGWSVYRLSPDDKLERILGKVTPVGLAWDMDQATQRDWDLIDQLRRHPQCAQLPFILFGKEQDRETGFTSVLTKPLNGNTFLETLSALRPAAASGLILVVDDDPEAREFYQRILRETLPGHTMQLAENGAEALALMEQTVPNLVVLDLIMPEVDGFTVLERMRANHLTRHVPVLVVSGRGLTLQDVQRLDYARVTFQSKGLLTPEEAIATVQAALTGQTPLPQATSKLVKRALVYIHQNYHRPLARQDIASAVSVNEDYLSRMFRKEMGLSLWECLTRYRILKAQELLIGADDSIIEVAAQVGFEDSNYFSRVFHQYTGQSPQAYRQQPR